MLPTFGTWQIIESSVEWIFNYDFFFLSIQCEIVFEYVLKIFMPKIKIVIFHFFTHKIKAHKKIFLLNAWKNIFLVLFTEKCDKKWEKLWVTLWPWLLNASPHWRVLDKFHSLDHHQNDYHIHLIQLMNYYWWCQLLNERRNENKWKKNDNRNSHSKKKLIENWIFHLTAVWCIFVCAAFLEEVWQCLDFVCLQSLRAHFNYGFLRHWLSGASLINIWDKTAHCSRCLIIETLKRTVSRTYTKEPAQTITVKSLLP